MMKQLLRFPLFFFFFVPLNLNFIWRCCEASCPKLTISSFKCEVLSGISRSLERECKVKLRTKLVLGFIEYHCCLTRPMSPQCLSFHSPVKRDFIPASQQCRGAPGSLQRCQRSAAGACFNVAAASSACLCMERGRRSLQGHRREVFHSQSRVGDLRLVAL